MLFVMTNEGIFFQVDVVDIRQECSTNVSNVINDMSLSDIGEQENSSTIDTDMDQSQVNKIMLLICTAPLEHPMMICIMQALCYNRP